GGDRAPPPIAPPCGRVNAGGGCRMTGLAQIATPFLAVDIDLLDENIARMRDAIIGNGIRWRPHIKSIKSPPIATKLQAAGAEGVTCAKVGEAEIMVRAGIRDILIANQVGTRPPSAALSRSTRTPRL